MNVGQLRQLIQDLPDDVEVLAFYIPAEYTDKVSGTQLCPLYIRKIS